MGMPGLGIYGATKGAVASMVYTWSMELAGTGVRVNGLSPFGATTIGQRHSDEPIDEEAEITKLKDGRTALAYKAEDAVDMETGAIVAVTTHGGAAADTATVTETVIEAGVAVAELMEVEPAEGESGVHPEGVQEVVADKGYHSNDVLVELAELEVRSYIAEPDRGPRNWDGRQTEKQAVYGNRRRIQGPRGKRLQRQRGERIERNFAHQFDTGGLDRLYVRGLDNVHKKLLLQAAACNLALLMRSMYGSGKPRAAHEGVIELVFAFLALMKAFENSIDAIRAASADELATVPGITPKLATLIKESL